MTDSAMLHFVGIYVSDCHFTGKTPMTDSGMLHFMGIYVSDCHFTGKTPMTQRASSQNSLSECFQQENIAD